MATEAQICLTVGRRYILYVPLLGPFSRQSGELLRWRDAKNPSQPFPTLFNNIWELWCWKNRKVVFWIAKLVCYLKPCSVHLKQLDWMRYILNEQDAKAWGKIHTANGILKTIYEQFIENHLILNPSHLTQSNKLLPIFPCPMPSPELIPWVRQLYLSNWATTSWQQQSSGHLYFCTPNMVFQNAPKAKAEQWCKITFLDIFHPLFLREIFEWLKR